MEGGTVVERPYGVLGWKVSDGVLQISLEDDDSGERWYSEYGAESK